METTNGKPILEHQDYLYIFNKESSNKVIWCCRSYRHNKWRSRLHTINEQVVQRTDEHNYEPMHSAGELIVTSTKMNDTAKHTGPLTHDIVADCVSKLSDHAIATLPNLQILNAPLNEFVKDIRIHYHCELVVIYLLLMYNI